MRHWEITYGVTLHWADSAVAVYRLVVRYRNTAVGNTPDTVGRKPFTDFVTPR